MIDLIKTLRDMGAIKITFDAQVLTSVEFAALGPVTGVSVLEARPVGREPAVPREGDQRLEWMKAVVGE